MIIHKDSHTDHAITPAQWDYIVEQFKNRSSFFIETIELPEHLGTVMNGLYGPSCGDSAIPESEVFYARRGDRAWDSRMTKMPARPTAFVRVIAGPHEEKCSRCDGTGTGSYNEMMYAGSFPVPGGFSCSQCVGGVIKYACILYTAYGVASKDMQTAPKEPGDVMAQFLSIAGTDAATDAELDELEKLRLEACLFWASHALASEVV